MIVGIVRAAARHAIGAAGAGNRGARDLGKIRVAHRARRLARAAALRLAGSRGAANSVTIVVDAEAAACDCLAGAEDVVGEAQTRSVEQRIHGVAGQWNGRIRVESSPQQVQTMPAHAGQIRNAGRNVLFVPGLRPCRNAKDAGGVRIRSIVGCAQAEIESQPAGNLPIVLAVEAKRVAAHVGSGDRLNGVRAGQICHEIQHRIQSKGRIRQSPNRPIPDGAVGPIHLAKTGLFVVHHVVAGADL
jgi:hypothetical protein